MGIDVAKEIKRETKRNRGNKENYEMVRRASTIESKITKLTLSFPPFEPSSQLMVSR